jgi:hypothetical protein
MTGAKKRLVCKTPLPAAAPHQSPTWVYQFCFLRGAHTHRTNRGSLMTCSFSGAPPGRPGSPNQPSNVVGLVKRERKKTPIILLYLAHITFTYRGWVRYFSGRLSHFFSKSGLVARCRVPEMLDLGRRQLRRPHRKGFLGPFMPFC